MSVTNEHSSLIGIQDVMLTSGGLAIKTGSSALAKTVSDVYYTYDGVIKKIAAADMAALSGTVLTTAYNVFVFSADKSAGTLATTMGTAWATLAAVVLPKIAASSIVIGMVIIHPTGTGSFVWGSSTLDDVTIVPNAVYINMNNAFNALYR